MTFLSNNQHDYGVGCTQQPGHKSNQQDKRQHRRGNAPAKTVKADAVLPRVALGAPVGPDEHQREDQTLSYGSAPRVTQMRAPAVLALVFWHALAPIRTVDRWSLDAHPKEKTPAGQMWPC